MDYSEVFTYNFTMPTIVLAVIGLLAMIIGILIWSIALGKVRCRSLDDDDEVMPPDESFPELSVVIYANNHGENIENLLNDIFRQDYPAATEVIVVNDESFDNTEDIVGRMELQHSNLYLTYTPAASRNLSRRKLSLTLGVKAARYDYVVFTHGNCRIPSEKWLRQIGRHFAEGKTVVAGYAYSSPGSDMTGAVKVRAFDRVFQALSRLCPAIDGRIRRADGRNLAYSRKLFFDKKGFSKSLNLNYGDDDIFISEISDYYNSSVELSEASMVEYTEPIPVKAHAFEKLIRKFTGGYVGNGWSPLLTIGCWMLWIALGCWVAASITAIPSLIPAIACFALFITGWITMGLLWRRTAIVLHSCPLNLTVLPLMMWHPFYEMYYTIRNHRDSKKNFTWTN